MQFLKKHFKKLGTLITIIALCFVVWKMVTMDVDYTIFASPRTLCILLLSIVMQTLIFCYMTFPWLRLVQILSGKKISAKQAVPVYTKANLMKYIPGNVFQYVARNQLAAEARISHVDVALATILDILMSMLAPFLFSICLMGSSIVKAIAAYRGTFLLILCIGVAVLLLLFCIIRWKFWQSAKQYLLRYRRLLQKETLLQVLAAFLLYLLQSALSIFLYALPLLGIIIIPSNMVLQFLGAYLFSWIIGFITPGSPGGIGVREAVMMLICSTFTDSSVIVLYVVVMRLVSTCADVAAFGVGAIYKKMQERKKLTACEKM